MLAAVMLNLLLLITCQHIDNAYMLTLSRYIVYHICFMWQQSNICKYAYNPTHTHTQWNHLCEIIPDGPAAGIKMRKCRAIKRCVTIHQGHTSTAIRMRESLHFIPVSVNTGRKLSILSWRKAVRFNYTNSYYISVIYQNIIKRRTA